MAANVPFQDFDNADIYQISKRKAQDQSTKNFVVEFGKSEAQIAFDVGVEHVRTLLSSPAPAERPVRWM